MLIILMCMYILAAEATQCKENQNCASCGKSGKCSSECDNGFYGPKCNLTCSTGCINNTCQVYYTGIGECTHGCKHGFYGTKCNIPCTKHENTCKKCPQECEGGLCQLGSSCAQGCQDSFYGTACKSCPAGCKVCNRVLGTCEVCLHCEGNCTQGCLEGCKAGYFGDFCEHTCSLGCLAGCDKTTGDCFKCNPGWFGAFCENQCPNRCTDEECDMNGICSLGCTLGWFGSRCDNECLPSCVGDRCDRNGRCTDGCKQGFHGEQCQKKCPEFCFNKLCDIEDGSCKSCKKAFYGSHCNKSCLGCIDGACSQHTGHCIQGCLSKYTGELCQHDCKENCTVDKCRDVCKASYEESDSSRSAESQSYFIIGVSLIFIVFLVIIVYATFHIKRIENEKFYRVNWHASNVEQGDTSSIDTSESDCSQVGVQVVVLKQPDAESHVSVKDEVVEKVIDDRELLMKIIVDKDFQSDSYTVRKLNIAGKKGESSETGNASVFEEDKTEMLEKEAAEYENAVVDGRAMREYEKKTASWIGNVNNQGKHKMRIVLERDTEYDNGVDDRKMVRKEKRPPCDRCFAEGKEKTSKIVEDDLILDNGVDDKKPLNVCLSNNPSDDGKEKMSVKDGIGYEDTEEATRQDEIDNFNDGQEKGSDTARDIGFDCIDEAEAAKSTDKASKGDEPFEGHDSDGRSDVPANTGMACDGYGTTMEPAKGNQDTFAEFTVREHQSACVAINEHDDDKHYVEVFLLND